MHAAAALQDADAAHRVYALQNSNFLLYLMGCVQPKHNIIPVHSKEIRIESNGQLKKINKMSRT